ncbi:MAG: hypothetical protein EBV15_10150, partial [Bacteroidetes bacterium]|nr:hypothetical protein [Bacteroidota bacterium]
MSKVIRIGILGALNGLRIRRWYKYDTPYSLESLCRQFNIPFYIVPGVNHGVTAEIIAKLNPDLGLSLGNGYISKRIFQIPKFGMINIHHEYLPDFQNAQSVIWQLYYGSPATGFSIHKISQKIDAGDILYRERVPIVFENSLKETVRCSIVDLYKKSSQKLPDVIANYKEYSDKATPQQAGKIHTTPKISEFMIM